MSLQAPTSMEYSRRASGVPSELRIRRRENVQRIMEAKGIAIKDILDNLPSGESPQQWRTYLTNLRSGGSGLTPERAARLGPAMGATAMELLIECSDIECARLESVLQGNNAPAAQSTVSLENNEAVATISNEELQQAQKVGLEKIIGEKQLSARKIAEMIEKDEFEIDVIAMQIADARQGNAILEKDLCNRITTALGVDASLLMPAPVLHSAGLPAAKAPGRTRRTTRRAPSQGEQPVAHDETDSANSEAIIELSLENLQKYFGGRTFKVLRTPEGRHILRAERAISKDELIEMLLSLHRK